MSWSTLAAPASLTMLRDVETGTHRARLPRALRLMRKSLRAISRFRDQLPPETMELLVSVSPIPNGIQQEMGRHTQGSSALERTNDPLATRRVCKIAAGRRSPFDPEIADALLAQQKRFYDVYVEERYRTGTAASA